MRRAERGHAALAEGGGDACGVSGGLGGGERGGKPVWVVGWGGWVSVVDCISNIGRGGRNELACIDELGA